MITIKVIHTTEQCNCGCNAEILSLLKQIKMGQEALEAKVAELKQTIIDEKAEVAAKLSDLEGTIAGLKDQLANGATAEEIQATIMTIDEAIAEVKGIVTTEPPVEEPPVV